MNVPLGTLARTHTCGELGAADVGKDVVLLGWVHRIGISDRWSSSTSAIAMA